jgi:hypothetical protein
MKKTITEVNKAIKNSDISIAVYTNANSKKSAVDELINLLPSNVKTVVYEDHLGYGGDHGGVHLSLLSIITCSVIKLPVCDWRYSTLFRSLASNRVIGCFSRKIA